MSEQCFEGLPTLISVHPEEIFKRRNANALAIGTVYVTSEYAPFLTRVSWCDDVYHIEIRLGIVE
jgi:hypothetical protein